MDLGYCLANIGELAPPGLRILLTRRVRLLFEFVVSVIGRSFVTDRVSFLFVDGFFFQRSGSCEDGRLGLTRRRKWPVRMVGLRYYKFLVFFDELRLRHLVRIVLGRSRLPHRFAKAKFTVPVR